MKYALIGCGRVSPNHLQAALNVGLETVALCDTDPLAAEEKKARFGLDSARIYTSHSEMLEKEKPDLVAIATPSGSHARIALDCIGAGCSVIIEKPVALSLSDADAIIAAGKRAGVAVCVSHQNRFNRSVVKIRKALDEGRFGRLYHGAACVRWHRGESYYRQAPWRGTWAEDGGCIMNQCIHNIDLLRWMMGDGIREVTALTDRLAHPYIEAEDVGLAVVRFENGATGLIEGTTAAFGRDVEETLFIMGEKGTVKAGGRSDNIIEAWNFADGKDDPAAVTAEYSENPPSVYGFGHTPLYADTVDAIKNRRPPAVDAEAGRRAVELVLGIYLSSAERRPVSFPLENCGTADFAGLFDKKTGEKR